MFILTKTHFIVSLEALREGGVQMQYNSPDKAKYALIRIDVLYFEH